MATRGDAYELDVVAHVAGAEQRGPSTSMRRRAVHDGSVLLAFADLRLPAAALDIAPRGVDGSLELQL